MTLYSSFSNSYTSAFPALNSLPTFFQSRKRNGSYNYAACPHQHLLVPPKYPKYLKNTMFADLVHEQYEAIHNKQKKQQTNNNNNNNNNNADQDINWYDLDLRLPTAWNTNDKASHIDVTDDGLELKYSGERGRTEGHAGSVRSNFPMKPQCGVFYYETKIISKGEDGYIGIGFFTKINDLDRLPGWDTDSFGYHGDDGHSFGGSGTGDHYGPCFTTGDVIGCGVNFDDGSAFYTKNGTFLGIAFSNIDLNKSYYPAIGLRTPGEHVETNFGHEEFVFDLDSYIEKKKYSLKKEIILKDEIHHPLKESSQTLQPENKNIINLILSHLINNGYGETAKLLYSDCEDIIGSDSTLLKRKLDDNDVKQRQSIRQAIMDGDIDKSISLTNNYYPGILQENEHGMDMIFELECGKFIEIMRSYMEHKSSLEENQSNKSKNNNSNNSTTSNLFNNVVKEEPSIMNYSMSRSHSDSVINNNNDNNNHRSLESMTYSTSDHHLKLLQQQNNHKNTSPSRRLSWASIAASSNQHSERMECQEILKSFKNHSCDTTFSPSSSYSSLPITSTSTSGTDMTESHQLTPMDISPLDENNCIFEEDESVSSNSTDEIGANILTSAMNLGQQLQNRCRSDPRSHINQRLTEIFSLFAYSKIENSPAAHLLDISCRDKLATKLNDLILESKYENKLSILEKSYQQIIVVNKQLAYDGNGKSVLLKMDSLDNIPSITNTFDV